MSFVATWMADLACNQYHLRKESSVCPWVSLYGTSDINEHMCPFDSRESELLKLSLWFLLHYRVFL